LVDQQKPLPSIPTAESAGETWRFPGVPVDRGIYSPLRERKETNNMIPKELLKIENEIKDSIPFQEGRTRQQYAWVFRGRIISLGYKARKAVRGWDGNCLICGEAGRCPGYHITERG